MIRLKEDYVIPKGTEFDTAPVKTERHGPHWQAIIGTSKDSVFYIDINEDTVAERPDLFEDSEKAMIKEEEIHYLGQMLTATSENDTQRLHSIIKRLQELS